VALLVPLPVAGSRLRLDGGAIARSPRNQ
jgi:hypothetical protein